MNKDAVNFNAVSNAPGIKLDVTNPGSIMTNHGAGLYRINLAPLMVPVIPFNP